MKKNIKRLLCIVPCALCIILTLICVFGCKEEKTETPSAPTDTTQANKDEGLSDIIVVYFSCTNNTKFVAECIAKELHCGIFEIVPTEKYTDEDLNWQNKDSRVNKEHDNPNILPSIGKLMPQLSVYKTLIIGYPIWYGEAPPVMRTFVRDCGEFPKGLRVIPFCTSHASPMGNSAKHLFKDVPNINLEEGKRFELKPSEEEVTEWVKSLNLK